MVLPVVDTRIPTSRLPLTHASNRSATVGSRMSTEPTPTRRPGWAATASARYELSNP